MLDWIRDNWEFLVGTLLGVAGILVGVWVARASNTLDYRVVLFAPLLSPHASKVPIKVTFLDNELSDPHIIRLRVENTGKRAVRAGDYVEPITVWLKGPDLVQAFVAETSVADLVPPDPTDVAFLPDEAGFSFHPDLMNAGDWFEVQMFCDGEPEGVRVSARYADQTRAVANLGRRQDTRLFHVMLGVDVVLLLFAAYVFLTAGSERFSAVLFPAFVLVGAVGLTAGMASKIRAYQNSMTQYG